MPVIPCGVAIIRRGRQFLISQRKRNDTFGSYWEFPGGRKLPKEALPQCAAREAREELGVEVRVESRFAEARRRYDEKEIWLNFFLCSYEGGEPRPLECERVQWVDVRELKKFRFPPANRPVIEKLLRRFGPRRAAGVDSRRAEEPAETARRKE